MRKETGLLICHQWAKHEIEILHKGGNSNCTECYQQFKEQDSLNKQLDSFFKDDLGEGKYLCHVTLVNADGEQLLNKSLLHLVDFTIWWNIAEKWAMCGKNHLMCFSRRSSIARVTSLPSLLSTKSMYRILLSKLII